MPRSSRGSAGVGKEKKTMETIRNLIVTEEGGLTGAGYAVFIILGIAALLVGAYIAGRSSTRKKMTARELAFCAVAIALAYAASFVPLFRMPFGGSVTLFSMLFIVLIAYWYGPQTGILVGFAYGVLQFLQEPYYLSLLQVCLDYLVAFAALGVAGFFRNRKNGLIKGYLAAVFARGVFASLAGYLFWMEYMPDNFPKSLTAVYPIVYNYMYLIAEAVLTVILLAIPAMKKAVAQVTKMAHGN